MSPLNELLPEKGNPFPAANEGRGDNSSNTPTICHRQKSATSRFVELSSSELRGQVSYAITKLIQGPFEWVFWKLEQRLAKIEVDIMLRQHRR
jgi:hypothetical protein